MIEPELPPDILDNEWLARMVFAKRHFRPSDNTVKPEAFMPPPDLNLSVTRHMHLTEEEIWETGRQIGVKREKELYGRADVQAGAFRENLLDVRSDPPPPSHAVAYKWPLDKDKQMIIALELAKRAKYFRSP